MGFTELVLLLDTLDDSLDSSLSCSSKLKQFKSMKLWVKLYLNPVTADLFLAFGTAFIWVLGAPDFSFLVPFLSNLTYKKIDKSLIVYLFE